MGNRLFDIQSMQFLEANRQTAAFQNYLMKNKEVRTASDKLLLAPGLYHGDVNFVDNSLSHHVVSGYAGIMHTVDQSPFRGSNSIDFIKASSQYLTIPDHADWDLFAVVDTEFTIDFFIKRRSVSTAGIAQIVLCQYVDASNYFMIYLSGTNTIRFLVRSGASNIISCASAMVYDDLDFWRHITIAKIPNIDGTTASYGIYLDGIQVAFLNDNSTASFAGLLYFGQLGVGSLYLDGWLANVRISHRNVFGVIPVVGLTDTFPIPIAINDWAGD